MSRACLGVAPWIGGWVAVALVDCAAPVSPVLLPSVASATAVPAAPVASHAAHQGSHAPAPTCAEIAKLCHPHDAEGGVARECHRLGHAETSTEEACAARRAECIAACSGAKVDR